MYLFLGSSVVEQTAVNRSVAGSNPARGAILVFLMIVCWNVNSISSRLNHLIKLIKEQSPKIILLQELKCTQEKFPYEQLEDLGYNIKIFGQKTYNGVAILSKFPLEDTIIGLEGMGNEQEARYIENTITIKKTCYKIISAYVPNGSEVGSEKFMYKLNFYKKLEERLIKLINSGENLIIGADFNIAPEEIDAFNPNHSDGKLLFSTEERQSFRRLLNLGLIDTYREFNKDTQKFSWWDYRAGSWQHNKGMRIDHILASPMVADKITATGILSETRGWEKPSDHAPIYIKF